MARELGVKAIHVFCDSKLVSAQVNAEFQAREPRMAAYLQLAQSVISCFDSFEITHIPRAENSEADQLARIGSGIDKNSELPVDILCSPSTDGTSINQVDEEPTWMTPIVGFLLRGELPQDRTEARTLRMRAARYTYLAGQLYKRGFSNPLLKCVTPDQGLYIMREIHEGVCGNHAGKRSLLHKIYVRRCDACQRFSPLIHQPAEELNSVLSPWPFAKWGIDLIGPLPLGKYRMKFAVVAIDYYTKWVEAEPLSEITEARTTSFVWKNIVCRFGIPHSLVSDNGTQFDSRGLKKLCSELGIRKHFASVAHPQSNGQVEAVNKTIKRNLERKLEGLKNAWVEELPRVLWAYRTTSRTATGKTPFSMTYGTEAVLPVEVGEPSFRTIRFDWKTTIRAWL
ncbi:hypothetical protein UlMin_035880 [Ulmus minor]